MAACSVVIPAHDEAATIGRCLQALQEDPLWTQMEVVVVCNACTDETASVARAFVPAERVIETALASKAAALDAGDAVATAFPRVYLDADVTVGPGAVSALVTTMAMTGLDVAAPAVRFDVPATGRCAAAYHRVWSRCPHFGPGHVGAGLYALSRAGRSRFGRFPPDAIADDLFVMRLFAPAERGTTPGTYHPRMPGTIRDLLRVQRRHHAARQGLRAHARSSGAGLLREDPDVGRGWLLRLCRETALIPAIVLYVVVNVVARAWAAVPTRAPRWERDASSRQGAWTGTSTTC